MSESSVPEIRLSDQERDQVIGQLNLAMTDGRIDIAEFEQRSRLVYAAKVPSDLEGVLDGLPVTPPAPPVPVTDVSPRGRRWFLSLLGDRTNRGNLDLSGQGISLSLLGDTTFDLTQVTTPTANLRVFSVLGDVTILVPPGTRVDSSVVSLLGDREETAGAPAATGGIDLRLQVYALLGDVRIRMVESPI